MGGSGFWTPIGGGVPGSAPTAYPIPYTLLSLPRFARMVGIAPLHFAGVTASSLNPQVFPTGSSCGDVWPRYDWQKSDQVSHESLAYAIKDAEESLAKEVGYFPAPMWIARERQMYPRDFYREGIYQVRDVRGFLKGLNTKYGKILNGGRRGIEFIASATTLAGSLAYTDNDSDGLFETATITIPVTTTDACEYKVYFTGTNGQQDWEIRTPRVVDLTGGVLTLEFESWLFVEPGLLYAFPTDEGFQAVDMSTVASLVTAVDVYREYNDTSLASAVFQWENNAPTCEFCGGTGCTVCSDIEQDGCIQVRDPEAGIVVPTPAAYNGTWTGSSFDVCRAPDKVELYYQAGDQSNEYLRGISCDPLSDIWAWCIIWLAIARLERPPCSCNRLKNMFDYLREDLAHNASEGSYFMGMDLQTNPFGTHRGEMMAWKRVKHHTGRRMSVAVI
jgi:hypothetical protein